MFLCRTVNRTSDGGGGIEIWPQNPQGEGTFFFFECAYLRDQLLKPGYRLFFYVLEKAFYLLIATAKPIHFYEDIAALFTHKTCLRYVFFNFKNVPIKEKFTKLCISQSYDIKYHFVIKVSDLNVLRLK